LEKSSGTMGEELLKLDKTVWEIRRYCAFMRAVYIKNDGSEIEDLPFCLKRISHSYFAKRPNRYTIHGGFLEKILKQKDDPRRAALVWKNCYYGKKNEACHK